jgi:hypothetical protein
MCNNNDIDSLFAQLPQPEQQQLLVALEGGFMQVVYYEEKKWIGVNVVGKIAEQTAGAWSMGTT